MRELLDDPSPPHAQGGLARKESILNYPMIGKTAISRPILLAGSSDCKSKSLGLHGAAYADGG
jgi:hypothetical protein